MTNKKMTAILLILFILIFLNLQACSVSQENEKTIKVGVIAPITGDISTVGTSTVNAAHLAVDEINNAGGLLVNNTRYTIEIVIEDNEDKEQAAVDAAKKLINKDGVVAIIGPQASRNAIPVSTIAENSQIPMISPWSTNPLTTEGKDYVFRVAFIDSFQGQVMARFTFEELTGNCELCQNKVAVLYDIASDYNKGIAEIYKDVIENAGGKVVAFESYTTGETDFSKQLQVIQASGANVLFLPNYYNEVPEQIRQAKAMGLEMNFIGSDSWSGIAQTDLPDLEGSFFSTHYSPDTANETAKNFIAAYQERYQKIPDDVAALTYDAFGLLFQAIQSQGETTPEAIRSGLATTKAYTGVTGTMEYRGTGDPIKSAVIIKIENGKMVFYKEAKP